MASSPIPRLFATLVHFTSVRLPFSWGNVYGVNNPSTDFVYTPTRFACLVSAYDSPGPRPYQVTYSNCFGMRSSRPILAAVWVRPFPGPLSPRILRHQFHTPEI